MFESFVKRVREQVEERLSELLIEPSAHPRIVEAMRFATLGAGKRVRPLLVIASGEASVPDPLSPDAASRFLTAAAAVEMVHTFSLIHDDLPALDDDNLRRGRPTLHVQFDEATAILAGDALLNRAYHVLAEGEEKTSLAAIRTLTRAVGLGGMISGQVMDLEFEDSPVDAETLHTIHAMKTGALIRASCEIGGILAGADVASVESLSEYGRHLGLAFQIVDDILDVEGSAEDLGKSPGKDQKVNKATFPSMWGVDESRRRARECVEKAHEAAGLFRDRADNLIGIADAVLTRRR